MSSVRDRIAEMNAKSMAEKLAAKAGVTVQPEEQAIATPAVIPPTRPIRENENQTLYKSSRPTMNFRTSSGERVSFTKGYLLTEDAGVKSHIGQNFMGGPVPLVTVLEEGPLTKAEE